jgi:hypothetical protein
MSFFSASTLQEMHCVGSTVIPSRSPLKINEHLVVKKSNIYRFSGFPYNGLRCYCQSLLDLCSPFISDFSQGLRCFSVQHARRKSSWSAWWNVREA